MRSILLLTFSLLISSLCQAKIIGELGFGTGYESNIYLQNSSPESSSVIILQPQVQWLLESKSFQVKSNIEGDSKSYSKNSKASRTEYDAGLEFSYKREDFFKIGLEANLSKEISPLLEEIADEAPYVTNSNIGVNTKLRLSAKSQIYLFTRTLTDKYSPDTFNYLNSVESLGGLEYSFSFLPETELIFGLQVGTKKFADGKIYYDLDDTTETVKFDNSSSYAYGGIRGRLTRYTSINVKFGLKKLSYVEEASFSEPVFNVEFVDQSSPKDIILAGYDYRSEDSTFTNWVLTQDMYIGYSRLIRDIFIFRTRLSYVNYSYSLPQRREDQRINAKFHLDYVYVPKWTVSMGAHIDLLSSDVLNSESSTDRAASYTNNQFYLQLKRSF